MTNPVPYLFDPKLSGENDDFTIDFKYLIAPHETIQTAAVDAVPSGLTISNPVVNGSKVTAWIAAGSVGTSYNLTYTITTDTLDTQGNPRQLAVAAILNCE